MRLQYIQGEERTVHHRVRGPGGKVLKVITYLFNPIADVLPECGENLLRDHPALFLKLDDEDKTLEVFECNFCHKKMKSLAGLGSHKRTHKGQQT